MSSIRPFIPRGGFSLHSRQLQSRLLARHASTNSPPKPRLLEKPERFNPPSHPSRIRAEPKYYGAPLTEHERHAQKTRRYPHMMPPEGTFMHWFLTDRSLHLYISLGILVSLVCTIWYRDFLSNSPYLDLLPPNSLFFSHPFQFLARYWEVYEMSVAYNSAQVAERRRLKSEDVAKRAEYRKAHGIGQEEGVFGGWTVKGEELSPAAKGKGEMVAGSAGSAGAGPAAGQVEDASPVAPEGTYVDFEGNVRGVNERKKWFGIW